VGTARKRAFAHPTGSLHFEFLPCLALANHLYIAVLLTKDEPLEGGENEPAGGVWKRTQ
jgi:hypothetical protein